jgi:hypothetical protein
MCKERDEYKYLFTSWIKEKNYHMHRDNNEYIT